MADPYKLYQGKYPVPADAKYVIDYIIGSEPARLHTYYALIRIEDEAILYTNGSKEQTLIECWKRGIPYNEVAFI